MVEGSREVDEVAAGETCRMGLSKQLPEELVDDGQVHRCGIRKGGREETEVESLSGWRSQFEVWRGASGWSGSH